MRRCGHALVLLLAVGGFLLVGPVSPALASTQHVTNCNDSGSGSLRDALFFGFDGDTILFDLDCTGPSTIVLSSELDIGGAITKTIDGSGHSVTISGGGIDRIFEVDAGSTLNLSHVTLEDGAVTANGGGAIWNRTPTSTLVVSKTTFDGNSSTSGGGAIYNSGTATIRASTFTGNQATNVSDGGAIFGDGTLTVQRSTFTGNSADLHGGAIAVALTASMTVQNSTFNGNTAADGGAVATFSGTPTATLQNDTLSGDTATSAGAEIDNAAGTLNVANTIVANGVTSSNCAGTISDQGYNLDDGSSCGFSDHDVSGEPALGSLANNGGPTQTMKPAATSPALGAGSATTCQASGVDDVDQRGSARNAVSRGDCDIGAYDTGANAPSATTSAMTRGPSKITADGISTSTITVIAKDANGNRVDGGGATVTLQTTLGSLGSVTDNGDGTYTATLTSVTTAGTATITGKLNSVDLTASGVV